MPSNADFAWLMRRMGYITPEELSDRINHATPEQCAEAMTRCTPEAEEWGRRFEDAGKS